MPGAFSKPVLATILASALLAGPLTARPDDGCTRKALDSAQALHVCAYGDGSLAITHISTNGTWAREYIALPEEDCGLACAAALKQVRVVSRKGEEWRGGPAPDPERYCHYTLSQDGSSYRVCTYSQEKEPGLFDVSGFGGEYAGLVRAWIDLGGRIPR